MSDKKIEAAKGEEKLKLIYDLSLKYGSDKENSEYIAIWLEKEASKLKNMKYLAASYSCRAWYYVLADDLDSTVYYAQLSEDIYEKYKIESTYTGYMHMINMYLAKGHYELAVHKLKVLLEKGTYDQEYMMYRMLGMSYTLMNKLDLAEYNMQKAIDLYQNIDNHSPSLLAYIYANLAEIQCQAKKYETSLNTCSIVEEILTKNVSTFSKNDIDGTLYRLYSLYAANYIEMGNAAKGKIYLDKLSALPILESMIAAKYYINIIYSNYYFLLKDYDKSLPYLTESWAYFKKENGHFVMSKYVKRIVQIYEIQGRKNEALDFLKEYSFYQDSLFQKDLPLQMSELQKYYEIEKLKVEREKEKVELERSQAIIAGLSLFILSLGFILYLVRRNARKVKEKNKILFKKQEEVDRYIAFAKEHFRLQEEAKETLKKTPSLFDQIETYMKQEEIYRNSEVNKEEFAMVLKTNRQYLTDAIKAETGKTFMEYINEYRLNYARQQLLADGFTPVSNIITDAGFLSHATFYRLFKEKFGMTPNEMRNIRAELEEGVILKTQEIE